MESLHRTHAMADGDEEKGGDNIIADERLLSPLPTTDPR